MKKLLLAVCLVSVSANVFAAEETESDSNWTLNIRRIGLDLSQTSVRNAAEYSNSPIQPLRASSQEFIRGVTDVVLEHREGHLSWDNSLFMEFGRTKLKPHDAPATSNENADKILAASNLSYACWESGGFKFGPMTTLQYETEFTSNEGTPRRNVARANAGLSIFDHEIVKSLYLAGVYEYDFTFSETKISKLAAEIGWRLEYEVREGVKFSTNGYYREYLDYSHYIGTDLERDLSAILRLDTNLWGSFTMGPYVQYRLAKSREADVYASNFIIGISFNYITKFGL